MLEITTFDGFRSDVGKAFRFGFGQKMSSAVSIFRAHLLTFHTEGWEEPQLAAVAKAEKDAQLHRYAIH